MEAPGSLPATTRAELAGGHACVPSVPRDRNPSLNLNMLFFRKPMTRKPLTTEELTELTTGLHRLARNLWWTWDQGAQDIFQELSPRGWQNLYHNAVAILREVSDYELRVRLQDLDFAQRVREVLRSFDAYMSDKLTLAHQQKSPLLQNPVGYFSAEFGFHETLPIAAGGLGVLAGDHTNSANELRMRFDLISLLYREGYYQ